LEISYRQELLGVGPIIPTDSGVTTVICRDGSVLGWGQNNKKRANLGFHGNFEIPGLLEDTLKELGIRIIGFFLDTANPKS